MNVNFIDEINTFERWLETNYLPPLSQLLWYKLFALFNRCGWSEWVTVDNQRLMVLLNIKRQATFIEVRDKLIAAGLVEFQKGKKGSPNRYRMVFFCFKYVPQTEVNTVLQTVPYTEVNTVPYTVNINKLNQTKHIKKENKEKKPKPDKQTYAEAVTMTTEEYQKLCDRVDEGFAAECVKVLNGYKLSNGKKYASDYHAILNWVVDKVSGYYQPKGEIHRSDEPVLKPTADDIKNKSLEALFCGK